MLWVVIIIKKIFWGHRCVFYGVWPSIILRVKSMAHRSMVSRVRGLVVWTLNRPDCIITIELRVCVASCMTTRYRTLSAGKLNNSIVSNRSSIFAYFCDFHVHIFQNYSIDRRNPLTDANDAALIVDSSIMSTMKSYDPTYCVSVCPHTSCGPGHNHRSSGSCTRWAK